MKSNCSAKKPRIEFVTEFFFRHGIDLLRALTQSRPFSATFCFKQMARFCSVLLKRVELLECYVYDFIYTSEKTEALGVVPETKPLVIQTLHATELPGPGQFPAVNVPV
jgi:hypothetical protein